MTSGCTDKRFADMLYAYELGMLTEEQREEFELHLLECADCNERARQFMPAARVIRFDPDLRETVDRLAEAPEVDGMLPAREAVKSKWRKKSWIIATPPLLAAAAIILVLILTDWKVEISPTQEAVAVENRLAVMYFENVADRGDSRGLGEIITNLLITDLTESQYLQVVSSQRLYDILKSLGTEEAAVLNQETALQVARKAQAKLMLTGSILQVDPHFEISAHVIDVSSGNLIASQRIAGEEDDDIFSMVDKLTVEVKSDLALPPGALQEPDRRVAEVTTHSADAYRYYLDGVSYYRKLYYTEAALSLYRAVELDSTFAMAYYRLAELANPELIHTAMRFIDHAGRREQFYIRSRDAQIRGDAEQAAAELQSLIDEYPDEKNALYALGRLRFRMQNYDEAIGLLEQVIALDSTHKLAYNELAYASDYIGDYEKALWAINKYIAIAPDEANPYDTRSDIYARHGDLDSAIASAEQALRIKPDYTVSLQKLGRLHLYKREYDTALTLMQQYISRVGGPLALEARLNLAFIPLQQGKLTEALSVLDIGLQTERLELPRPTANPYHTLKYLYKCRIVSEQGRPDLAVKEFEKYLEFDKRDFPDSLPDYQHIYVQLLLENDNLGRAVETAEELKRNLEQKNQPLHSYWYAVGCIQLATDKPDSAIQSFDQAMRRSGDFRTYFMQARAYQAAGKLDQAITYYKSLLSSYTASRAFELIWSVKSHYYLGMAYEESQQPHNAAEQYETFLDIWQNANADLPAVEDARARLTRLRQPG